MKFSHAFGAVLVTAFGCCANAADKTASEPRIPSQVSPGADIAALYPEASHVGFAVAIVPDPHVPRYRRLFDLQVQAITLGMLNDGYVLDRYVFPWSGTVSDEESRSGAAKDGGTKAANTTDADKGAFGLMVFRCDGWRGRPCADPSIASPQPHRQGMRTTRIRAIYFVTDTATWGVASGPLKCATRQIRTQLTGKPEIDDLCSAPETPAPGASRVALLKFSGCPTEDGRKTLVLLGPNFSGAMDSIGQQLGGLLDSEVTDVCLVSGFTTVGSNLHAPNRYKNLHYVRMALDDGVKLLSLANLAQSFGYFDPKEPPPVPGTVRRKEVAFLTEASTFGYGICSPSQSMTGEALARVTEFCADAETLYFPAAIADIRYGLDQQREREKNDVQTAMQAALPSEHLTLDVGAENGSEFPENRQSKLTAASQQLALDHVLSRLEQSEPKMVVVVATDVRDRLFLFDQLRRRLPSALLVDLETDILLAHPDFLHASRGAITVASASLFVRAGRLFGCESRFQKSAGIRVPLASWAVDGQGMLADAVTRLDEFGQNAPPCIADKATSARRMPVLHVITLNGMRQISRAFDPASASGVWAEKARKTRMQRQLDLRISQWLAFFCCVVVVLPWLRIRTLQQTAAIRFFPAAITLITGLASLIVWFFAMRAAYAGEDPESGYALMYWSAMILVLAMVGLYTCVRRLHECCPQAGELPGRYRWAITTGGVLACVLAAVPGLLRYLPVTDAPPPLDDDLVTRLALDIGQGLAYHVVTAVGAVTVLFVLIALSTGACIMTRNNDLLSIKGPGNDGYAGARSPRFPRAAIGVMAALIVFLAVPSLAAKFGGARLSIFGPLASLVATLVLVITTLGASVLTVVAIHSSRRIRAMAAHIGRCVPLEKSEDGKTVLECPGLWPPCDWQPNLFPATPMVVRVSPELVHGLNQGTRIGEHETKTWKKLVSEFVDRRKEVNANGGIHRRAVYALLGSEISLYRWFVGGAVLCALASVCTAYLFPLEADPLLLWNLGVLIAHALLAGYVATAFERDGVLSNILCNRPKKAAFSVSLFTYAALPFFALGFAIAVSQIPGVVDWGGGILTLLGAIGLGP